ncbi:MAG: hypothetical protein EOO02_15335 [Chitinophagaceae bacterium]|nr:MAG: hypothetical protein EOO02_15335 [Chitinophagaceae bacterium]
MAENHPKEHKLKGGANVKFTDVVYTIKGLSHNDDGVPVVWVRNPETGEEFEVPETAVQEVK